MNIEDLPSQVKPPISFEDWSAKRDFRLKRDFPAEWIKEIANFSQGSRIVVVLHAHYEDSVENIIAMLNNIPVDFDLISTSTNKVLEHIPPQTLPFLKSQLHLRVENRGRDIWPLVQVVNSGILDSYSLVLKVHTKKSPWVEDHGSISANGDEWRENLLQGILGSSEIVAQIIGEFAQNLDLGIVVSPGNIYGKQNWHWNYEMCVELGKRIQTKVDLNNLSFPAGSIYWCRAFVIQGLRSLDLTRNDFQEEDGQIDGTTAHAIERLIGFLTIESGLDITTSESIEKNTDHVRIHLPTLKNHYSVNFSRKRVAKALAYYLPQFHSIEENDAWWGKGFTEWANVASARPLFTGHNQPLLPQGLGYYSLSDIETLSEQTKLAKTHGVEAFVYYYYWFSGKKILDQPLIAHVSSAIKMPFFVLWANENWTRKWDGGISDILLEQRHTEVDPADFIDDVIPLMKDDRYFKINGAPVLAVYRLAQLPDYRATLEIWKDRALQEGIPNLHLLSVDVGAHFDGVANISADVEVGIISGAIEFPPHNKPASFNADLNIPNYSGEGATLDYAGVVDRYRDEARKGTDFGRIPGAMVNFDNTARVGAKSNLYFGSNPFIFRKWVRLLILAIADRPEQERVFVINAWNEWAESAVLEPTRAHGYNYLQAINDVLGN